ncbi:hypothetical protein MRX96_037324 [Rhipicephalus microplus]
MCIVVSNSVTMLFIGRVTCGIWLGVSTNTVNLYVIEVAPAAKRTFFGGLTEVALSVGMLASYVLGGIEWHISAILFMLAPVPVFVLQACVVENPRWFATKGRYRDSNTAMVRLYGDDAPTDMRLSRTGEDSNISAMGRQKMVRMLTVSVLLSLLRNMSCAQLVLLRAVQVTGPPGGRDVTAGGGLPLVRHARQLHDAVHRPDPLDRPPPAAHPLLGAGRRRAVHLTAVRPRRFQRVVARGC